jgi:hypothetical protein
MGGLDLNFYSPGICQNSEHAYNSTTLQSAAYLSTLEI